MDSGPPPGGLPVPAPVAAAAGAAPVRPVWVNELGGATFEIGTGHRRRFVKWAPAGSGIDLAAEAARMSWAAEFTPVPTLLAHGADETGSWLVTSALPGEMAVSDHQHLSIEAALEVLAAPPPVDELVVCHGDSCAPNTLITDDGCWSGHVDLGDLGIADRWADLAVATWSTTWNYGPGWQTPLLNAYGIAPDADRTRYYRLLWDLGP